MPFTSADFDPRSPYEWPQALACAARQLEAARRAEGAREALATALEETIEIWASIRAMTARQATGLAPEVRTNLHRIADYVIGTVRREGIHLAEETMDSLVNINTQIALRLQDGLSEAA
ncbi:MAG: hypothetical protein HC826_00650 [Rhodospirillales bacterium]|nr:hypothetical protein [Rhodospirillales bacterium]